MVLQLNIADAKARLSALVEAALRGEEVILAKAGTPVARIVSLRPSAPPRPHLLAALSYPDVSFEAFAPEPDVLEAVAAPLERGRTS
jgi:prevent-host-death family protein